MPSYFYHLRLEVLPNSNSSEAPSLSLESAWEALLPFQKRAGPLSSRPLSGATSDLQSSSQAPQRELTLERRPKEAHSFGPSVTSHSHKRTAKDIQTDIRSGAIVIECIDMVAPEDGPAKRTQKRGSLPTAEENLVAAGIGTDILGGLRTKGRYIPLDQKVADSVFGIVHLYRDTQETPYLAGNDDDYPTYLKGSAAAARHPGEQHAGFQPLMQGASTGQARGRGKEAAYPFPVTASASVEEEDCTTLCILAVPSYLSPSDFLGFVGERTRDSVSHFRMIRTSRANRYMVLLKFRSGRKAKEWQKEWNGKVFNSMEVCLHLILLGFGTGSRANMIVYSLRLVTLFLSSQLRSRSSSLAHHLPILPMNRLLDKQSLPVNHWRHQLRH
jgi:BRCA1-associated protein